MIKAELLIPGRRKGTRVKVYVYLRRREQMKILQNEDVIPGQKRKLPWWKKPLGWIGRGF